LREVWGHHSHSRKWDLRGLQDSQKLRVRLQGSKHLTLRCSLYRWKYLKRRCQKWPCNVHLDICSTSYVRKKGQESNWKFDSRPLKVKNRPNLGACRQSAAHCQKALKESYKFALDLIPIGGLSKELWVDKVPRVHSGTISGLPLGSLGTNSHLDVVPMEWRKVYYMGEGGGFPRVQVVVSQVSPELPMVCPSTKGVLECELTNLLVNFMQVRVSE
jgi:hypothetical protein